MHLATLRLVLFSLSILSASAQSSTAKWLFPTADGMIINYIDTVVLQWTSNFADPWMQMWCQNGTTGNNVVIGSEFQVNASGSYPYILSKDDPSQTSFAVACHAELVTATNGGGVDDPVGVTFVSLAGVDAKTFSLGSTSSSTTAITTSQSSSSTSLSSSSSSGSTSFSISVLPSNTASPSASASVVPGGMSSGAKAGIGVGVAVVVLGIIGVSGWLFWKKRSKKVHYSRPDLPEFGEDERKRHELLAPHGHTELEVQRQKSRIYELAAES